MSRLTILASGSRVGGYTVDQLMRTGPHGAVYRATQPRFGRTVSLYVAAGAPGSLDAERFLASAKRLARLDHPNLLPVYDAGTAGGVTFAAAASGGQPLSELLHRRPLPADRAVAIGTQVAVALTETVGAAHTTLDPVSILVLDENGAPHAYLSPLEPAAGGFKGDSAVSLARLLDTMVGGADSADPKLADVINRGLGGGYEAPGALADAALAAIAPRPAARRTRRLAAIVGAAVAAACCAAIALSLGGSDSDPTASAPVGRLAATIPVGGSPASVSFGEGALWVATEERRLVRIDPDTNRVQGAPIRLSTRRDSSSPVVRVGQGAVVAIDGQMIVRVDASGGRVVRRARTGHIVLDADVDGATLWITRTTPETVTPRRGELVPLDAHTLRPTGRPVRVGVDPFDVEVSDGALFVTDGGYGTLTRFDPASGATRTVAAGSLAWGMALAGEALWVPSWADGTITRFDLELRHPRPSLAVRYPLTAVSLGSDVWVVGTESANPGSRGRLYRIDANSGRFLGRGLEVGDVNGLGVGDGSLWLPAADRRAVLRVSPSTPSAAPRPAVPAREGTVRAGPLTAGMKRAAVSGIEFSFAARDSGWYALPPHGPRKDLVLQRYNRPRVILLISVPKRVFTSTGGVRPARSPASLLAALRRHPRVDLGPVRDGIIGRLPARTVDFRVEPHRGYPWFCEAPCVTLWSSGGPSVATAEYPYAHRTTVLRVGRQTLEISRQSPPDGSGFRLTEPVVRSLRLR